VVVGVDQAQLGTSASNLTFNDEGMFSSIVCVTR